MAGSLAVALPLPGLAASRDLATHPDAELLALGQKLNETVRAYLAIQPAHRVAERRYGEAFRAAFQGVAWISDEERIPRMREAFAPFAADLGPGDSLLTEWDRLSGEIIKNHRPTSLAGVAVVASVVAAWHHAEWLKPADDRDWPEQQADDR